MCLSSFLFLSDNERRKKTMLASENECKVTNRQAMLKTLRKIYSFEKSHSYVPMA